MDFERQILTRAHPRPELQFGPSAMRKRELLQYARRFGLQVEDHLTKDVLVKMLEVQIEQGKIPHPYQPNEHPLMENQRTLEARNKMLEERLAQLEARISPQIVASGEEGAEGGAAATPIAEMTWPELKAYAKEKGIATYGKKRDEILAELE